MWALVVDLARVSAASLELARAVARVQAPVVVRASARVAAAAPEWSAARASAWAEDASVTYGLPRDKRHVS